MGVFEFIAYSIIGIISIFICVVSYLIFRFLRKKTDHFLIYIVTIIPIISWSYLLYRVYNPSNSFYEGHYKSVTGMDFPEDGTIISGKVLDMDDFGDATYVTIADVGKTHVKQIPKILKNKGYKDIIPINDNELYNSILPKEFRRNTEKHELKSIHEFHHEKLGENIIVKILEDSSSVSITISHW